MSTPIEFQFKLAPMKTPFRKFATWITTGEVFLLAVLFAATYAMGHSKALANQSLAKQTISASPWVKTDYARIRLIPGAQHSANSAPSDGQSMARSIGVQIELDPGWHTYWRNPGASGVPPRFDWSNSTNVVAAKVLWPAPHRIRDEYGVSFGYNDLVVFPVHISAENADQQIGLKLGIDYAVCREICIPVFSELSLELPAGALASADLMAKVANFEAKVPLPQPKDESKTIGPRIEQTQIQLKDGKPVLAVTARLGATPAKADIFIEGPEEFFFATPDEPKDIGDGRGLYIVEIKGAETAEDLAGAKLGCTIVNASGATEHWWVVPKV